MKIIDKATKEVYFDTKMNNERKFFVSKNFWKRLKAGEIFYRDGGETNGVDYTNILNLKINSGNFEEIFRQIANSEVGKAVMAGKLPVDTVL